jgi:hypothetical protein
MYFNGAGAFEDRGYDDSNKHFKLRCYLSYALEFAAVRVLHTTGSKMSWMRIEATIRRNHPPNRDVTKALTNAHTMLQLANPETAPIPYPDLLGLTVRKYISTGATIRKALGIIDPEQCADEYIKQIWQIESPRFKGIIGYVKFSGLQEDGETVADNQDEWFDNLQGVAQTGIVAGEILSQTDKSIEISFRSTDEPYTIEVSPYMRAPWLFAGYGPDGAPFAPSRKDVSTLNPQFDDPMPTDVDAENAGTSIFFTQKCHLCAKNVCWCRYRRDVVQRDHRDRRLNHNTTTPTTIK